mgnify:FL=1|tara:strand:+ start:582 stop:1001 length:420 start_codon:yes stop_codon:yes gene_type:complete
MDSDTEIFKGKTFSSLVKDIYFNSSHKKEQINQLIKDLREMVKDLGSATVIAPMIKDYIDVGIKNDDQLVKLSAVLQRFIAGTSGGGDDGATGGGLSDAEKEQLLSTVKKELDDLEKTNSVVEKTLDNADVPNEEKLIG